MQMLDNNLDDLLEAWENIKDLPIPVPCTLNEALEFTDLKQTLTTLSHKIRNSRLENDIFTEEICLEQFCNVYNTFSKEYVYRILKNERKSQSTHT